MTIHELISKHIEQYSKSLQQKLEELKGLYVEALENVGIPLAHSNLGRIDEVRVEVKSLEAKMDALRELEEDVKRTINQQMQKSNPIIGRSVEDI